MITSLHALAAILAMLMVAALRLRAQRDGPRRRLRPRAWTGPVSQPSAPTFAEAADPRTASDMSPEVRRPLPTVGRPHRRQRTGLQRRTHLGRARARPRWSRTSRPKISNGPALLEGKS
jgi:hypothetical protein